MPAGFYWDGILFIILGTFGLIGSLFMQLSVVPGWRARARAMKDNSDERKEVKTAIKDDEDDAESEDDVEDDSTETDEDSKLESGEESEDDGEESEDDDEQDEIDIGSYIGLVLDDEEVYGTIIEFDDEEDTVTIETEDGDEVTANQDDMFLDDEDDE